MSHAGAMRVSALAALFCIAAPAAAQFPGFDRNGYPGDAALPTLRKSFRYAGFWLNAPPGERVNTWTGKRAILENNGFGFLVLFKGRSDAELKSNHAAAMGKRDGEAAAAAALRERFPRSVLIFLDLEEGGRLLPEQAAYVFAWIDAVRGAGARAGVYCSGIEVRDESGTTSTAADIAAREAVRESSRSGPAGETKLALWIADDACPPSPGCTLNGPAMETAIPRELRPYATVWQYAQSPRRAQFSASCPQNAAPNGNCYAPGLPGTKVFVDLDVADAADPSGGR